MTTPIKNYGEYKDWYLATGQVTPSIAYQQPKVANLLDVQDYTGHPNQFVVVGASGGWDYSATNGSTGTNQFKNLLDVDWASAEAGDYVVVNSDKTGLTYESAATVINSVNNFYTLNDTFDYRVGADVSDSLVKVNQNQTAISHTAFAISEIPNVILDSSSTLCAWFTDDSGRMHYCMRNKMRFEWSITTDQSEEFANSLTGYDTGSVLYTNDSWNPSDWHVIAFGSFHIGGSNNNIRTRQTQIITDTASLFTFNASAGTITLTDFAVSTQYGPKYLISGHSFCVTVSGYIQYHNNPSNSNYGSAVQLGYRTLNSAGQVQTYYYDTSTLVVYKPGPSAKFAKKFFVEIPHGWAVQPVYFNTWLGSNGGSNPGSEIDLVDMKISIDEI